MRIILSINYLQILNLTNGRWLCYVFPKKGKRPSCEWYRYS